MLQMCKCFVLFCSINISVLFNLVFVFNFVLLH